MRKTPINKIIFSCFLSSAFIHYSYAKSLPVSNEALIIHEVKHDTSLPLIWMHENKFGLHVKPYISPIRHLPSGKSEFSTTKDIAFQISEGVASDITIINNFIGIGVGLGGYAPQSTPPDTTGAPGLTQYMQIVNVSLAVFNKADGSLQYGPVNTNTVWNGFGGICETTNNGDALVKFDQLANRWIISQFAHNTVNNQAAPPFVQCVAVSTTPDALSSYNRYAFSFDNFNDYGKLGISPNGYFMSFFMFSQQGGFLGPMACALPRDNMIAGTAASMQCFNPNPQSNLIDLIPADLDGQRTPPVKTPEFYLSLNKQTHQLALWKLSVNWNTPSESTFKGPIKIPGISPFSLPCTDQGSRDPDEAGTGCVPQPNTNQLLDMLDDRLMFRLAYREFPAYGTLVINHSVRGATAIAGVRWYQINILHDGLVDPHLIQQGTFTPDANSRWMGSIAIDKNKNIALGYSVSSNAVFPSISVTGRMPMDTLGSMRNEVNILSGGGSQTGTFRWGDYSTMSIDPVDDCTFWYTTEYLQTTGASANWSTRIASFRFPNCS